MAKPKPAQYDTLLRIRKRQEDIKAQALAVTRRSIRIAERQRADLAKYQRLTLEKAGALALERFDPSEVRMYYQYERHLATLIDEKDASILELRSAAEERRAELEDAMKRRRIVEKLQERLQSAFMKQVRKDEQTRADEVATNLAAMRRGRARLGASGPKSAQARGHAVREEEGGLR